MKAAILVEQKKPLLIENINCPDLDIGQVLVKIMASGICGRQIGEITGSKGEDKFLPHLLGHEGGGVVEKIGPGVKSVAPGDRVVCHWRKGTGIESNFPVYKLGNQNIGGGLVTTFSEIAIISENRLTKINEDIPFEIAALMGCATTTALGLVNNEAKIKIGQSVAILGCGSVGLSLLQACSLVSAYPIIGVDMHEKKIKAAKRFNASHVINTNEISLNEGINKIVGSSGVDVVIDTTGVVSLMSEGYGSVKSGGTMVMVGQPHFDKSLTFERMASNFNGKKLIDSEGGKTNPTIDIPRYLNMYKYGLIDFKKLITNYYELNDINNAVRDIINGKVIGKAMIKLNSY